METRRTGAAWTMMACRGVAMPRTCGWRWFSLWPLATRRAPSLWASAVLAQTLRLRVHRHGPVPRHHLRGWGRSSPPYEETPYDEDGTASTGWVAQAALIGLGVDLSQTVRRLAFEFSTVCTGSSYSWPLPTSSCTTRVVSFPM